MGKSFFCNSGAEANEAALKLARKYFYRRQEGWKNQVVVFKDSFHGRTLATVTATGQAKYQEGFAPLPEGFAYAEFNNLDSVKEVINENTCAIMLEAVQGEGGINPVHPEFVQGLRQLCDEKHMLLIFDEVQCGMGRSGKFFAFENYGVKADIVTIAKSLAGGVPIGVMMATDEASSGFAPGDHGSTFGGNPLATAVACKVLDIIGDPAFLQQVQEKGQYLKDSLNSLGDDRITEVRGIGLILGMEFNTEVKELINLCMDKGLLLLSAGPKTIRFVPPLTINTTEINQGVAIIREALKEW
jgi:acetylornithine/succinyldiaminopimelate/putrescine aminotransferase